MKPNEYILSKTLELIRLVSGKSEITGFTKYLNNIEYKSAEELKILQAVELSKMLRHAVERIPFYNEFKGKLELSPESVHDDIKEFPVMTRDMLAAHYDELVDMEIKGGTRLLGGGTTGTQTVTI
ncbi:MAG: hypothetical protein JW903_07880, partial [Clostridia bacterium]|nr:hypothetical protein [Clostridia bacterium]